MLLAMAAAALWVTRWFIYPSIPAQNLSIALIAIAALLKRVMRL